MGTILFFIGVIGAIITFVGMLVVAAKKKQGVKTWAFTFAGFLVLLAIGSLFITTTTPDDGGQEAQQPTTQTKELSEAEKFAAENDISVQLAEDIEQALAKSEHAYDLSQIYQWTQIEGYAYGQRYTGWMDMEYVWVFYVNEDRLESIRQQVDLSFIYQAE